MQSRLGNHIFFIKDKLLVRQRLCLGTKYVVQYHHSNHVSDHSECCYLEVIQKWVKQIINVFLLNRKIKEHFKNLEENLNDTEYHHRQTKNIRLKKEVHINRSKFKFIISKFEILQLVKYPITVIIIRP